jgi:hypothetical protein
VSEALSTSFFTPDPLTRMQIKATMKPGQNGTKKLADKYGDRLVCVRYRYDPVAARRYTTVELIEDDAPTPEAPIVDAPGTVSRDTQLLGVRIEYWENELRQLLKAVGGIWRPPQKLWEIRYADVVALGLESRVVSREGDNP